MNYSGNWYRYCCVEVDSLPLMVDCRAGGELPPAAAAPHPALAHHLAPNGQSAPQDNHHPQGVPNNVPGEMQQAAHGVPSPAPAPTTNTLTTYAGGMNNSGGYMGAPYCGVGVKSLVWMSGAPPHPPPPVNPHVYKSVQPSGADLPMNDIPTLRYYFNLGVDCMWASYGPPPHMAPHHHPPRHYSPRDLAQDMQQISLHERPASNHALADGHAKHKVNSLNDKPANNNQNKGNGPRPLLGPRFKRGNHQDGNQNNHNHNQNKGHNNMANKGPNNRRNCHSENSGRGGGHPGAAAGYAAGDADLAPEPAVLTLPYIPYPPPIYPVSYYPVDTEPGMMGMMGGMGYVGFDEGVEYGAPLPYYAGAYPPPMHAPPHPHPHHIDHK